MQGKALLVREGAAAFLALLGAVQGRTGHMQRVVPQMHGQGTAVGKPLVACGALKGLLDGGGEVLGGGPLEVENRKHSHICLGGVGEIVRHTDKRYLRSQL